MHYHQILLSTAYLPAISYMATVKLSEKAEIEIHETYPKQTWRNRCRILTSNGPYDLSIPVVRPDGNHTKMSDILISHHAPWQKTHWQTILSAYAKAPYFMYYRDALEVLFQKRFDGKLIDWNQVLMSTLFPHFKIKTQLLNTEKFSKTENNHPDLRHFFSPKPGSPRFQSAGVFPEYIQVFSDKTDFVKDLSCIDLLFNLGPDASRYLELVGTKLTAQLRTG
jgi:hypothetical protein